VVSFIALLATVGVYGFVALLVRMDDVGFKMIAAAGEKGGILKTSGEILVVALPKVIKVLTIVGTLAMLLVAGGIFMHNLHSLHEALHFMPGLLAELLVGLSVGALAVGVEKIFMRIKNRQ
jgi:uncharacterized protein